MTSRCQPSSPTKAGRPVMPKRGRGRNAAPAGRAAAVSRIDPWSPLNHDTGVTTRESSWPVKCIVFLALAGECWSKKKVTNWITSGGQAARRCTDDKRLETSALSRTGAALSVGFALMLTALAAHLGHARDRGQFGNVHPDLKAWFV